MGYAGGPSVRRRCAEATAPQIAKSIGRRIYLAEAALGARSRRRRPFGAAGGGGAAFLSLPRAVWSPSILSPTANGLLVAPGTHAHGACKTRSHQISVMTERRRRRPICGPFDLLGPLRTYHAEFQTNRATTAAVASYVQNPGRSQISVMTERRRRRTIRELSHLRRSPRTHHAEFQANRATTAPAAASHIKAWGAPRRRWGRFRGGLLLLLLYSTLLYSTSILLYSTSTGQVN